MSGMKNEDLLMLYTSGQSYKEFIETNSGFYKEEILNFKSCIEFPETFVREIKALDDEKYFLAIAEPWCENSIINISMLEVAAEINKKINYKIVPQLELGNHMQALLDERLDSIPIILELTSTGDIVGIFCEKPTILRELDKESSVIRTAMKRKYKEGGFAEETVREILKI
jgi:hypothetical protein